MSNSCANSDSVFSPLTAASATFALKAGVWFRRARLLIVSPDSRANLARRQAETPLIALFRFPEPALLEQFPKCKGCLRMTKGCMMPILVSSYGGPDWTKEQWLGIVAPRRVPLDQGRIGGPG